jgi:hypothetical protein
VPAAYRFLDRWVIPEPIERVYDAIGDPLRYDRWWTDFVFAGERRRRSAAPGKRNELLVKAYLPYKVNFGLEVLSAARQILALIKYLTPLLRSWRSPLRIAPVVVRTEKRVEHGLGPVGRFLQRPQPGASRPSGRVGS